MTNLATLQEIKLLTTELTYSADYISDLTDELDYLIRKEERKEKKQAETAETVENQTIEVGDEVELLELPETKFKTNIEIGGIYPVKGVYKDVLILNNSNLVFKHRVKLHKKSSEIIKIGSKVLIAQTFECEVINRTEQIYYCRCYANNMIIQCELKDLKLLR